MPLNADWLPVSTPLDPAEDPPGSLDPLGTLLPAEGLAEVEDARVQKPSPRMRGSADIWKKRALDFKNSFRYSDRAAQILGNQPSSVSLPLEGWPPRVGGTLLTSEGDFGGALP